MIGLNKQQNLPPLVDIIGQIADLKEVDYKNTLVLTALIELLVEKGWIERKDVMSRVQLLHHELDQAILEFPLEHNSHS